MGIGEKIKALRERRGMTLEELGDKVGVGKSTVRKWETGAIADMRRNKVALLASALGVSPSYLMEWDEQEMKSAEESADAAVVSLQVRNDKDMVQALKVYFKMPPDKKRHVVETIHLIGGK